MENIVHTADSDEEPVHMPVFIIVDIENDKVSTRRLYKMVKSDFFDMKDRSGSRSV